MDYLRKLLPVGGMYWQANGAEYAARESGYGREDWGQIGSKDYASGENPVAGSCRE